MPSSVFQSSSDADRVIDVLNDADCRKIVAVLDQPLTARQVASAADLPVSTTYRKLDRLTETPLVRETFGIRRDQHHEARYVTAFEDVTIGLDDDRSLRVAVERSVSNSNEALAGIWSQVRSET